MCVSGKVKRVFVSDVFICVLMFMLGTGNVTHFLTNSLLKKKHRPAIFSPPSLTPYFSLTTLPQITHSPPYTPTTHASNTNFHHEHHHGSTDAATFRRLCEEDGGSSGDGQSHRHGRAPQEEVPQTHHHHSAPR